MSRFDHLPDRARELASTVGERVRHVVPKQAGGLLEAGVALGALRTGGRVAAGFVRRNPVVAVALAAGAGALWYAARRKARQAENAPIEGSAKRVEARRPAKASRRRSTARTAPTE
ncbi:MAG TPA: hypothetical protein VFS82_08180 [Lysobacter sp.]|nr:hypothetical protein [Lysobacter sp.]